MPPGPVVTLSTPGLPVYAARYALRGHRTRLLMQVEDRLDARVRADEAGWLRGVGRSTEVAARRPVVVTQDDPTDRGRGHVRRQAGGGTMWCMRRCPESARGPSRIPMEVLAWNWLKAATCHHWAPGEGPRLSGLCIQLARPGITMNSPSSSNRAMFAGTAMADVVRRASLGDERGHVGVVLLTRSNPTDREATPDPIARAYRRL